MSDATRSTLRSALGGSMSECRPLIAIAAGFGDALLGRPVRMTEAADLVSVALTNADLQFADLRGADLREARLRVIDLIRPGWRTPTYVEATRRRLKLADVILTGARYDAHTRWPVGFDPQHHGAVLVK